MLACVEDTENELCRPGLIQCDNFDIKDLPEALRQSLLEILSWEKGAWTQVARGYEQIWHRYSRAEFEVPGRTLPELQWPGRAG